MRKSVIAIIVIVLVVLYMSVFVVKEGERGITLRFGKVLRDDENKPLVYAPGLHFKIPFIESVKMLDARIQTMDNQADRFVTKEKKDLIVDSYIKWRISDFSRYYLATGGGDRRCVWLAATSWASSPERRMAETRLRSCGIDRACTRLRSSGWRPVILQARRGGDDARQIGGDVSSGGSLRVVCTARADKHCRRRPR